MTQAYEEVMEMEFTEVEEFEHSTAQKSVESEVDELLGDLNPRYFEEVYSLEEAQNKVFSSDLIVSGNFNMFTPF